MKIIMIKTRILTRSRLKPNNSICYVKNRFFISIVSGSEHALEISLFE